MTPEQVLALLHEEDRERAARVIERMRRLSEAWRKILHTPGRPMTDETRGPTLDEQIAAMERVCRYARDTGTLSLALDTIAELHAALATLQRYERMEKLNMEADGLLLEALRCAQKLRASFARNEIYPAAEYGWLVNKADAIREWRKQARAALDAAADDGRTMK